MTVHIPTPLQSYTGGVARVPGRGATLDAVLRDLDARYPGIRFRVIDEQDRIRPHIRIFRNSDVAQTIDEAVEERDEVHLIAALSGG